MEDSKVAVSERNLENCNVGCKEVNITHNYNHTTICNPNNNDATIDLDQLDLLLREKLREEADIASGEMILPVNLDHPINAVKLEISSELQAERHTLEETGHFHRRLDFLNLFKQPQGNVMMSQLFQLAWERATEEAERRCRLQPVKERHVAIHGRIVGVVGQAGIGKTTLAKMMARRILDEGFLDVDYIFYIPFRVIDYKSRTNLLRFLITSSSCRWDYNIETDHKLMKKIEESSKCVVILDGLDEAVMGTTSKPPSLASPDDENSAENFIKNILCGKILTRAKKFVTSRPRQLFGMNPELRPHFIVNVLGLSEASQIELCKEICGDDAEEVIRYLRGHPDISAYCYVPVNCILTVFCIHRSFSDEETANLYSITSVLVYALDGYVRSDHLRGNEFEALKLAHLAWSGFLNSKVIFDEDDLKEAEINEETLRAFLQTYVDSNMRVKILDGDKKSYFSHLIWQEFFSAVELMLCRSLPEFQEEISNFGDGRWEVVAKFVFGLCNNLTFKRLQKILPLERSQKERVLRDWNKKKNLLRDFALKSMPADLISIDTMHEFLRVCDWINETNDYDITSHVVDDAPIEINLADDILPSDVTSIHYFLRSSKKNHILRVGFGSAFNSVRFTGDGFERFFKQLPQASNVKLVKVMVERSTITDDGIRHLGACLDNIEELTLYKTNLSAAQVEILSGSISKLKKQLKKVDLTENPMIGEEGSRALARCLPNIAALALTRCGINSTAVHILCEGIKELKQPITLLQISSNREIGDEGAKSLCDVASKIKTLHLSHCKITSIGVEELVAKYTSIPEPGYSCRGLDIQFDDIDERRRNKELLTASARNYTERNK